MEEIEIIHPKERNHKFKCLFACNTLTSIQGMPYADHMRLIYTMGLEYPEIQFIQFFARRLTIDKFRNLAVKLAIDYDCKYIFFIDDDMQLPVDTFTKLYEGMINWDILAAFNYIRGYPFKIMAFKYDFLSSKNKRLINLVEEDVKDSNEGIVRCDAIGTAVCLIKTSLLKNTPSPWFLTGPHGTEDIYMCLKVKDHNFTVRIGMHTGVVTGHTLDPEVINRYTREALMKYYEYFMSPKEVVAAQRDDPRVAHVPNVGARELHYEDIMAADIHP